MELKKGYKQTEVGVIPEDWNVKPLGDMFGFSGGFSASRDQLSSEGYCYLHYGDIHKSAKTFIDVQAEYQDIPKLDIPLKRVSAASLLSDGDVVFVDASEDDEGASKHIVVINKEGIAFISGLHTIVTKSKTALLDNQYKRYCFQSRDIKRQFYYYAVGTKVTGISKTNISKIFLPVPPLPEQTAIATALSDTDALISSLEKLITKKRNIKQGTMQELLTGKKRLLGFSGKWEAKKLSEIGTPYGGLSGKSKKDFEDGKYPYIPFLNIMNNPVIDTDYFDYVNICSDESQNQAMKGDLFFNGSSETPEEVGMCSVLLEDIPNLYLNSFCFGFRLKKECRTDGLFLSYFFRSSVGRELFFSLAQGATRYNLSKNNFMKMGIPFPQPEEQTAIAQVLSDVDTEIEALEHKRDKYKAIKQGMMQELLTGKTRLI